MSVYEDIKADVQVLIGLIQRGNIGPMTIMSALAAINRIAAKRDVIIDFILEQNLPVDEVLDSIEQLAGAEAAARVRDVIQSRDFAMLGDAIDSKEEIMRRDKVEYVGLMGNDHKVKGVKLEGKNIKVQLEDDKEINLTLGLRKPLHFGVLALKIKRMSNNNSIVEKVFDYFRGVKLDILIFTELFGDLLGFPVVEENGIALNVKLQGELIAEFHEMMEYLWRKGLIHIESSADDSIDIKFGDTMTGLSLSEKDAIALLRKAKAAETKEKKFHYLLRAFQREVLKDVDRAFERRLGNHTGRKTSGIRKAAVNTMLGAAVAAVQKFYPEEGYDLITKKDRIEILLDDESSSFHVVFNYMRENKIAGNKFWEIVNEYLISKLGILSQEFSYDEIDVIELLENVDSVKAHLSDRNEVGNTGGIDLNPDMLELQTTGKGIDFNMPFDPKSIQSIQIDGFSPVIFQIVPTNLPMLIGIAESEAEQQLSLATR